MRQGKKKKRKWLEVETESSKACWSPKLQKLIGHAHVGPRLHAPVVLESGCRKREAAVLCKFFRLSANISNYNHKLSCYLCFRHFNQKRNIIDFSTTKLHKQTVFVFMIGEIE